MHNTSFDNYRHRAKEILEIIHLEMIGPHVEGYMVEKYFLTFIDDFSKIAKVFTIKAKSEFYDCSVEYVNQVENSTQKLYEYNRSVTDTARYLMSDGNLDIIFWPEMIKTAVYLKKKIEFLRILYRK